MGEVVSGWENRKVYVCLGGGGEEVFPFLLWRRTFPGMPPWLALRFPADAGERVQVPCGGDTWRKQTRSIY